MKRQLLAGRFGPDDQVDIPMAADEQRTLLQMVAGEKSLDHGIGSALTSLKKLGISFPSRGGNNHKGTCSNWANWDLLTSDTGQLEFP